MSAVHTGLRDLALTSRGKLADYMPRPYPNDEAARAGNGG
jgi:hypothetical protein